MDSIITLNDISFTYPDEESPVFTDLDINLPPGITSIMGQNGAGKTTMLLIAAARLFPQRGVVKILGQNSRNLDSEAERNRYVSFVYQNMEFETEESIGELTEYIFQNGFHEKKERSLIKELTKAFEIDNLLGKQLQNLSKGEKQRAILVFCLLYGSKIIMMDEPIFALEDRQKRQTMEYLTEYAKTRGVHLLYSIHEIEISSKYSDNVILFYKNGSIGLGTTEKVLTDKNLEEAYELPRSMLYKKESLFRDNLLMLSSIRPDSR